MSNNNLYILILFIDIYKIYILLCPLGRSADGVPHQLTTLHSFALCNCLCSFKKKNDEENNLKCVIRAFLTVSYQKWQIIILEREENMCINSYHRWYYTVASPARASITQHRNRASQTTFNFLLSGLTHRRVVIYTMNK